MKKLIVLVSMVVTSQMAMAADARPMNVEERTYTISSVTQEGVVCKADDDEENKTTCEIASGADEFFVGAKYSEEATSVYEVKASRITFYLRGDSEAIAKKLAEKPVVVKAAVAKVVADESEGSKQGLKW